MPLSATQMKYLALAWQCFETEPKIDYEKFHRIAGLASAHSARELMRVTKKKLKEEYGGDAPGGELNGNRDDDREGSVTPKATIRKKATPQKKFTTPNGTVGRKRGRKAVAEEEEQRDEEITSSSVGIAAQMMKKIKKENYEDEESDGEI